MIKKNIDRFFSHRLYKQILDSDLKILIYCGKYT